MPYKDPKGYLLNRRAKKEKAIQYKGGECQDCHNKFPSCVYDFHHLDPSQKDFDFKNLRNKKWETIKEEIDKCVLLCANCHRIRHKKD